MRKPVKLLLYLLLSAVILFFLWAQADCPRLTAQGALNRIESSHLLPKSRLISVPFMNQLVSDGVNYRRHMAAGLTDTHLHITEVRKGAFLWHSPNRHYNPLLSLPLEEGPMASFAPDEWPFDYSFFLYSPQPAESWVATVTVGDLSYTTEGACDPSGFTLFEFPQLEDCSETVGNNLKAHAYDMLNIGYAKDSKNMDISLTVALFDADGQPAGFTATEYPAS